LILEKVKIDASVSFNVGNLGTKLGVGVCFYFQVKCPCKQTDGEKDRQTD